MRTDFSFNSRASFGICGLGSFTLLAVAAIALGGAQMAWAQDSVTIKDPAEFNTYRSCSSQTDPKTKATCLESFLQTFPRSSAGTAVLDLQIDTYQGLNDAEMTLSAASRLLQLDPNNMKAIFISVFIKKGQCLKYVEQRTGRSTDMRTCDDAAALARRGLSLPKPDGTRENEWAKLTTGVYPVFHSAIALDDAFSKRDFKDAVAEYTTELKLYTEEQTKSAGLWDTLLLAGTYARPEVNDLVKSIWFYARVWNFAPNSTKDSIEKQLDYFYKSYHGNLNGLDEIKALAEASVFPPESFVISPAISPSGMPAQPRRRPAAVQAKSLALVIPSEEALPPPMSAMPGTPSWPANEQPLDATVTWDSQGLTISATNSSLQQILKDVATVTGATVEGLSADQRVFGIYGPGKARDVLSELLRGTSYNVLLIGDQGEGTPREIVLSSRHGGAGTIQPGNPTQNADEETDVDDQPQQQVPPPMRPGFGPGGQRGPQQMRPQPGQPVQPPNNPQ